MASMFENIPPWAMQQSQDRSFNPAPMIMSPFQPRGGGAPMQPPQLPPPPDPSGQASQQPQGMGAGLGALLGNPNSSNNPMAAGMGSGGLLQLIAAMQNGRQPAPTPGSAQSSDPLAAMLHPLGITPEQAQNIYRRPSVPEHLGPGVVRGPDGMLTKNGKPPDGYTGGQNNQPFWITDSQPPNLAELLRKLLSQ